MVILPIKLLKNLTINSHFIEYLYLSKFILLFLIYV
jgi:hypothetical protein